MEHRTTTKSFAENTIELFSAVKVADCAEARTLIKNDPNLVNASVVISGTDKMTVLLLNYILYCAKRGPGQGNEPKEKDLISLAKLVLSYDICNILNKTSDGDTALHTAIWYSYPEIAEIIIDKAKQKGCVKTLCAIKNNGFKETPMYVLVRKLKGQKITPEEQSSLEKIRILLLEAQQQEHRRKITQKIAQESFAATADQALKEFHTVLEEFLEDPISFTRFKDPIILPEGHTLSKDYFDDPLVKQNINPFTRSEFDENAKVPHVLIRKLVGLYQTFSAKELVEFFIAVEDLSCCPLTKQLLTHPCVIAEEGKVFKDGLDLYGYTCNKTAIEAKNVKTYPDILTPDILELKQKYNNKLKELEKSAIEKVEQSAKINKTKIAVSSTSSAEKPVTVYIEDTDTSHSLKRTFQLFSDDIEILENLEFDLMNAFASREYVIHSDLKGKVLKIEVNGNETINNKVTNFLVEKKILTWDEVKKQCALEAGETSAFVLVSTKAGSDGVTKIYQILSTPLYITQLKRELEIIKPYFEKQKGGILGLSKNPDNTEITITATDSELIKKLENFLVDRKKLTLEEVGQEAKIEHPLPDSITTQPKPDASSVNPAKEQLKAVAVPAAIPSVFSSSQKSPVSNQALPPKKTFPKPTKINIDSASARIILSYTGETITQVVTAIQQQLNYFPNIKLAPNKTDIYIYFGKNKPDKTVVPAGTYVIQENQQTKLYVKFPDEATKDNFISIFNIDSQYIASCWDDNTAINVGLGLFGQEEKLQQSPNCSII